MGKLERRKRLDWKDGTATAWKRVVDRRFERVITGKWEQYGDEGNEEKRLERLRTD